MDSTPEQLSVGLSSRQQEQLAAGLRRARDLARKSAVLDRYAPWGARRYATLWRVVRQGEVSAVDPDIWTLLSDGPKWAAPEDVFQLLLRVGEVRLSVLEGPFCDFWPASLDALACQAYFAHPQVFDAGLAQLPPIVRRGFSTVLRRFGKVRRESLPADLVGSMARTFLKGGFSSPIPVVRNQALVRVVPAPPHEPNADSLRRFVDIFATREAWARAVLSAGLTAKTAVEGRRLTAAFRLANPEQLRALLGRTATLTPSDAQAIASALRERLDLSNVIPVLADAAARGELGAERSDLADALARVSEARP